MRAATGGEIRDIELDELSNQIGKKKVRNNKIPPGNAGRRVEKRLKRDILKDYVPNMQKCLDRYRV